MVAILVLALVVLWLVLPIITLVKVSGIASEMWELRRLVKGLVNSDAKPKDKPNAEIKPEIVAKPEAEAKPEIMAKPEAEVKPEIVSKPEAEVKPEIVVKPKVPAPAPLVPPHVPEAPRPQPAPEPSAYDVFWSTIADWLAVRGDFAPAGMTREFAIATRWLVRIGSVILVAAIAYFMVLAIDKGWIGPAQRVYGMMFSGVFGIVAGTWIKRKKENYGIIGEVVAALGLVALYLSFGLGHRFFKPPVIESYAVTFAGLVATTVMAGVLSVQLRSLSIAVLGLVGGLLVPMIVQVGVEPVKLDAYLVMLVLGACVVAHLRRWTAFGFAAIVAVVAVFSGHDIDHGGMINGMFLSILYLLVPLLTLDGASARSRVGNNLCWTFVCICALAWTGAMAGIYFRPMGMWQVGGILAVASALHATLAVLCRCCRWQVGDGVPVLICIAVGFAAYALLTFLDGNESWRLPVFCLFAGVLAELHARSGERTFGALALVVAVLCAVAGMSFVAPECYREIARDGYGHALLVRLARLWCVPALLAFLGWRLDEDALDVPSVRATCCVFAVVMGLALLTCESHWFGKLFLPELKGGTVTIAWAVVALVSLLVGITCRRRFSRLVGLWMLAAAVVKLLLFDTASLPTPGRVGVFGLVGIVLIVCAFLYLKFKSKFEER